MMELRFENVSKTFKEKKAVRDVTMQLGKGIHGLIGANGSGKTTLMRMITGLLPMDHGNIFLDDHDILHNYTQFAGKLGYMPQHFGYYPHYKVYEYLDYMAMIKGLSKAEASKKIDTLIKTLHLEDKRKVKMKNLSGGMLKRVGIAQALLNDPEILILDEPTAGLDPKERIVFRNLIASLSQRCIVILSTHIVSDIESIADDICIMKHGEIIMQDTCEHLLHQMQGKVWEVSLTKKDADEMLMKHTIVRSQNKGAFREMRIVSDVKPHLDATCVESDLDDLYLYHFKEEGEFICAD